VEYLQLLAHEGGSGLHFAVIGTNIDAGQPFCWRRHHIHTLCLANDQTNFTIKTCRYSLSVPPSQSSGHDSYPFHPVVSHVPALVRPALARLARDNLEITISIPAVSRVSSPSQSF